MWQSRGTSDSHTQRDKPIVSHDDRRRIGRRPAAQIAKLGRNVSTFAGYTPTVTGRYRQIEFRNHNIETPTASTVTTIE